MRIDRLDKKNVAITIYINEGAQYHVGTLTIEGLHIVTEAEFPKSHQRSRRAKSFRRRNSKRTSKRSKTLTALRAMPTRRSTWRRRLQDPRLVNLAYKVDEGIQSFVEHINISGNSRTKDKVIRREIVLSPGDVFDTVRVDISKKRLEGLQYFERVDTYASDTAVSGRKDLNVVVQEKRTGNLNFGLGFSTTDGLVGLC